MSAALRKKLYAGGGVPPRVLRMQDFWTQLQRNTQIWTLEALDFESRPTIGTFNVISGRDAASILESPFSYFFGAHISPGLCAITVDGKCAVQSAAIRLRQDAASLDEATSLFIKLLCEQPVCALWQVVCAELQGHSTDAATEPLSDHKMVSGAFEAEHRYLQVAATFKMLGHETWVKFLFDLDYLQHQASTKLRIHAERRAQACAQSPKSLSDSVWASPVTLDAVLDRMSLSIGACSKLEVGNVLSLPNADPTKLALSAKTITGSFDIGIGELGVWKRQRAVKLQHPIADAVAREIVES